MMLRPSGVFETTYEQDTAIYRTRVDWFWGMTILLILLILPLLSSESPFFDAGAPVSVATIGIATRIFVFIIAVSGLNILLGYTGQISLGHAAFLMVGAYTSQALVDQGGVTFWLAVPISALFTGLVGLLFGIPSLRVRGFYLAMATLAAQFMIPWFIKHYKGSWVAGNEWEWIAYAVGALGGLSAGYFLGQQWFSWHKQRQGISLAFGAILALVGVLGSPIVLDFLRKIDLGGATGKAVSAPVLFGETLNTNLSMYYVVFVMMLLLAGAARNLVRSRIGRALISVRDNDLAAEQLGIDVFRYKLLAFFIAAIYAGFAGSLYAHSARSISPDAFNIQDSILYVGMLIIGGVGFPLGPTFGVTFFYLINDFFIPEVRPWLREQLPSVLTFVDSGNIDPALLPILFGSTLMIFLIFEPRGLAYRWAILQASWKLRPFSQG